MKLGHFCPAKPNLLKKNKKSRKREGIKNIHISKAYLRFEFKRYLESCSYFIQIDLSVPICLQLVIFFLPILLWNLCDFVIISIICAKSIFLPIPDIILYAYNRKNVTAEMYRCQKETLLLVHLEPVFHCLWVYSASQSALTRPSCIIHKFTVNQVNLCCTDVSLIEVHWGSLLFSVPQTHTSSCTVI